MGRQLDTRGFKSLRSRDNKKTKKTKKDNLNTFTTIIKVGKMTSQLSADVSSMPCCGERADGDDDLCG